MIDVADVVRALFYGLPVVGAFVAGISIGKWRERARCSTVISDAVRDGVERALAETLGGDDG